MFSTSIFTIGISANNFSNLQENTISKLIGSNSVGIRTSEQYNLLKNTIGFINSSTNAYGILFSENNNIAIQNNMTTVTGANTIGIVTQNNATNNLIDSNNLQHCGIPVSESTSPNSITRNISNNNGANPFVFATIGASKTNIYTTPKVDDFINIWGH